MSVNGHDTCESLAPARTGLEPAPERWTDAVAALAAPHGPVTRRITSFVGFSGLPNQVHRKSVRKGFSFTCMVVGESGLGKSSLVNALFKCVRVAWCD